MFNHKLGVYKWEALGHVYPLRNVEPPSEKKVEFAQRMLTAYWKKPLNINS
jgi:pyruvate formate lyase activating enzyme